MNQTTHSQPHDDLRIHEPPSPRDRTLKQKAARWCRAGWWSLPGWASSVFLHVAVITALPTLGLFGPWSASTQERELVTLHPEAESAVVEAELVEIELPAETRIDSSPANAATEIDVPEIDPNGRPQSAAQPPGTRAGNRRPLREVLRRAEELVAQLDADEDFLRDAATRELVELAVEREGAVTARLRQAAKSGSAQVRRHVEQVLKQADAEAPGHGLVVRLSTDKSSVAPGETVTLTTTITNTRFAPQRLYVGYSTGGVYFVSGAAFLMRQQDQSPQQRKQGSWCVGFCGTGAHPLFETIPARGKITYRTQATYYPQITPAELKQQRQQQAQAGHPRPRMVAAAHYRFGPNGFMYFNNPGGRTHRFLVRHEVQDEMNDERNPWNGKKPQVRRLPNMGYIVGKLESNEVEVHVAE